MAVSISKQDIMTVERALDDKTRAVEFSERLKYIRSATAFNDYRFIETLERCVIIFMLNDKYTNAYSDLQILNTKRSFCKCIDEYKSRYPMFEDEFFKIKLFVEDFYINPIRSDSSSGGG